MIVTGSLIPTSAEVGAAPLDTVDQSVILKTGTDDPQIALQKANPAFTGNGNLGSTNANINGNATYGGAEVQIHNLPTLVLFNGRRITNQPAAAGAGSQFVDVNLFPTSLIKRIEVLKDGASAIYGSDAIGGVVNVITNNDFVGLEIGGRYGFAETSDVSDNRYYLLTGLSNDKGTKLTIGVQYQRQDPIYSRDRQWAGPALGRTTNYPGVIRSGGQYYILNPGLNSPFDNGLNAPGTGTQNRGLTGVTPGTYQPQSVGQIVNGFDLSKATTITLFQRRFNVYTALEQPIYQKAIVAFGDFLYVQSDSRYQLNAQPVLTNSSSPASGNFVIPAGSPYNLFGTDVTSGTSTLAKNRFTAFPRQYAQNGDAWRIVLGLKGDITPKYSYESAFNYSRYKLAYEGFNNVIGTALNQAVAGGYDAAGNPVAGGPYSVVSGNVQPALNFFARNNPRAAFNGVVGTEFRDLETSLRDVDFTFRGFPIDLPAGPIGFAVGAEVRWETLIANTIPAIFLDANPVARINQSRRIYAGFGEIQIPVVSPSMKIPGVFSFDVDAAVRYEDYTDAGDSIVPKVSVLYRPIEDLAIRGTYSKSFIAPTLYQTQGPQTDGFSNAITIAGTPQGQAHVLGGANPALQPAKADTYTAGLVYSPKFAKGLTVSADFFEIDQTQIVGTVDPQTVASDVDARGTASPYASLLHFNNYGGPGVTGTGQVNGSIDNTYIVALNQNLGGQKIQGFDFAANYSHDFGRFGALSLGLAATYYIKYDTQVLPTEPYFNTLRLYTTTYNGTLPDYRLVPSLEYDYGGFTFTALGNYIPKIHDAGDAGDLAFGVNSTGNFPGGKLPKIRDYYRIDLTFSYEFGKGRKDEPVPTPKEAKDFKGKTVAAPNPIFTHRWYEGLRLSFGINNLTNAKPPRFTDTAVNDNTDTSTYDPYQRYFYFTASKKF